jgi:FAD:protein FMN transferase
MCNRFGAAALAALICFPAVAQLNPYEAVEPHMGSLTRIKLYARDRESAEKGFRAAFGRIAQLDAILSDYKPDSELSRLSSSAVGKPVRVSDDLARVVKAAEEISAATNGAFDITVGPLTHLWRKARRDNVLPSAEAVAQAEAICGFRKLHLDDAKQTVELDAVGMLLDVGGIAKGYAADEALAVLKKMGLPNALVAASGDLAFGDAPPGQPGWKIGIDSLDRADKPFTRVLSLSNAGVSTSGGDEQHLETGGKRYSHIINPKTGMGLQDDLTVTTIAQHGMLADAAATAISVLGREKGLVYVDSQPGLAALVLAKQNGQTRVFTSARFNYIGVTH